MNIGKPPIILVAKTVNRCDQHVIILKEADGEYATWRNDEAKAIYEYYEVGDTIR